MRDLIVTENIRLDGVIDVPKGWFNPSGDADVDDSDIAEAIREQASAADALLVGRVRFEQMRGYWPLQTDDTTGVSDYLNVQLPLQHPSTAPSQYEADVLAEPHKPEPTRRQLGRSMSAGASCVRSLPAGPPPSGLECREHWE